MDNKDNEVKYWVAFTLKAFAATIAFIYVIILISGLISPKINLYKKNTEKQAVIAEQQAKSKAAEYAAKSAVTQAQAKADAEVIRARGLAKAQKIISETLSPAYLRYLYIEAISGGKGQIIYVPTEGGLPILEAGRLGEEQTNAGG